MDVSSAIENHVGLTTNADGSAANDPSWEELQVPAVRAGKAVSGERLLEVALPFFQPSRIVERLDALATVDVDEAQLEGAGLHFTRFVTDVIVSALKPPEHEFLIGTS